MADSLDGLLAQIPGLGSYIAYGRYLDSEDKRKQAKEDEAAVRSSLISGDVSGLTKTPAGLGVAKTLMEIMKQQKDAAQMDKIDSMIGSGSGITPEIAEAIALRQGLAGKVGGQAWEARAEKMRQEARDRASLSGMKSAPAIAPDPQEAQQTADLGTPSVETVPAKAGAVPDFLMKSKYVGSSATDLQRRINSGMFQNSAAAEKALESLATAHNTMAQNEYMGQQRAIAAENLLGQRGEQKVNLTGGRESVYVQRMMMGANQAAKDVANIVQLPLTVSTGVLGGRRQGPGLIDATKEVLANKVTGQEAQAYQAMSAGFQRSLAQIEAAGLMPSGNLTHQMDAVLYKEGDFNSTKLHKLAQIRQIVEGGMEIIEANPRVSPEEKAKVLSVLDSIRKSVPFTHSDVIKLTAMQEANPKATMKDVLQSQAGQWSIRKR